MAKKPNPFTHASTMAKQMKKKGMPHGKAPTPMMKKMEKKEAY